MPAPASVSARLAVTPLAAIIPGAGRLRARLSQGAAGLAAGGRAAPIPAVAGVASGCDGLGASMVPVMPAGRRANWEAVLRAAGAASALPGVVS